MYAITAKGRRALIAWLARPAEDPKIESEAALKAFFAEHAQDRETVLTQLRRVVEWADRSHERGRRIARGYLDSSTLFPERMHVISIVFPFIWDSTAAMRRWALRAIDLVQTWEDPPALGTRALGRIPAGRVVRAGGRNLPPRVRGEAGALQTPGIAMPLLR